MFTDVERLVRAKIDPDYTPSAPDPFNFSGFNWPYDEANLLELWLQWEEHGFMPCAGDFFDQPPEWHQMIQVMRRVYGIIRHKVEILVRAKHDA